MPLGAWPYQGALIQNGTIPAAAMDSRTGVPLKTEVSIQASGWIAELATLGIKMWFSEGYRDLATQVYWKKQEALGNTPSAATPGFSNHGWAMAVDVNTNTWGNNSNSSTYATVVAVGRKYGFLKSIPSESWHFDYSLTPTIIVTDQEEEDDMPLTPEDIKKITDAVIPAVNNLFKLNPAGEAALNVSSVILTAPVKLDKDGTQVLSAVLNEVFYRGRANETAIRAIAAKLGVDLPE